MLLVSAPGNAGPREPILVRLRCDDHNSFVLYAANRTSLRNYDLVRRDFVNLKQVENIPLGFPTGRVPANFLKFQPPEIGAAVNGYPELGLLLILKQVADRKIAFLYCPDRTPKKEDAQSRCHHRKSDTVHRLTACLQFDILIIA